MGFIRGNDTLTPSHTYLFAKLRHVSTSVAHAGLIFPGTIKRNYRRGTGSGRAVYIGAMAGAAVLLLMSAFLDIVLVTLSILEYTIALILSPFAVLVYPLSQREDSINTGFCALESLFRWIEIQKLDTILTLDVKPCTKQGKCGQRYWIGGYCEVDWACENCLCYIHKLQELGAAPDVFDKLLIRGNVVSEYCPLLWTKPRIITADGFESLRTGEFLIHRTYDMKHFKWKRVYVRARESAAITQDGTEAVHESRDETEHASEPLLDENSRRNAVNRTAVPPNDNLHAVLDGATSAVEQDNNAEDSKSHLNLNDSDSRYCSSATCSKRELGYLLKYQLLRHRTEKLWYPIENELEFTALKSFSVAAKDWNKMGHSEYNNRNRHFIKLAGSTLLLALQGTVGLLQVEHDSSTTLRTLAIFVSTQLAWFKIISQVLLADVPMNSVTQEDFDVPSVARARAIRYIDMGDNQCVFSMRNLSWYTGSTLIGRQSATPVLPIELLLNANRLVDEQYVYCFSQSGLSTYRHRIEPDDVQSCWTCVDPEQGQKIVRVDRERELWTGITSESFIKPDFIIG